MVRWEPGPGQAGRPLLASAVFLAARLPTVSPAPANLAPPHHDIAAPAGEPAAELRDVSIAILWQQATDASTAGNQASDGRGYLTLFLIMAAVPIGFFVGLVVTVVGAIVACFRAGQPGISAQLITSTPSRG